MEASPWQLAHVLIRLWIWVNPPLSQCTQKREELHVQ